MQRVTVLLLFVIGVVLVTAEADAASVVLGTSKDNTLYENSSGGLSNGSGQHFFVGRTGQVVDYRRRGLLQFDIAGNIPAGATIQSVQLTLRLSKEPLAGGPQTVQLRRLLQDWGEGASDDLGNEGGGTLAGPGDATWLHTFYDTSLWTTPGGTFALASSASRVVDAVGFYTWGSTAQMVADVQDWLDNPSMNFGWLLLGDESVSQSAKRFDTKENATAGNRPQLLVEYTLPALPPVLDAIGPQVVAEGAPLNLQVSATDPNGTTPVLQAENLPPGAQFGDNNDGTGDFTFTPAFTQAGIYNVRFIASDGALADTELVEITVTEVTDPPAAASDSIVTLEEQPVSDVLGATDPDGDSVFFEIVGGPFHGTLTAFNAAVGTYTYEPNIDFDGEDSILFRASDGQAFSDTALVIVTVTGVNDPPVTADVAVSVSVNTPAAVPAMPVADVDNASWTIIQTAGPFHGAVSDFVAATGSFTYTPDLDYVGPDSVLYVADDGIAVSDTAVVRLTVADACACPLQADMDASGFRDAVDLNLQIDALFFGGTDPQDPNCPVTRADIDADGFADAVDLNFMIDLLFFGADPVDPCQL
ncbi:MAG: hypothetical protein Kow0074_17420 [Candidatus Zixiibacteriota bacterium]